MAAGYHRTRGSRGCVVLRLKPRPTSLSLLRRIAGPPFRGRRGCWLYNQSVAADPGDGLARLHLAICSPSPSGQEAIRATARRRPTPPKHVARRPPQATVAACPSRDAGGPRASSLRTLRGGSGLGPHSQARPQVASPAVRPTLIGSSRSSLTLTAPHRPQSHPWIMVHSVGGPSPGAAAGRSRWHAPARHALRQFAARDGGGAP
jgi:hypothetical protein